MKEARALAIGLVAIFAAATAVAQTRLDGTIEGTVRDSQGLVVPGATVTVSSPALIQTAEVTTGPEGRYRAARLPVGTYTVAVRMDGFNTVELTGIDLPVGAVLSLDATLEPSGATEVVTVEARSPVIDTQQVKNVQTITKDVVDQLPLSRDPITGPTQLAPGVVERTVAGSQRNETNYLIDGANMNAPDQGYAEAQVSWDAVEEIEFITTSNPVENYGTIGGTLNVITRTGGNQFSGMAQYYFTNKDLSQVLLPTESAQAIGVGEPSLPEYERDASFRLGGPIQKDKLWFVVSARRLTLENRGTFVPTTILGQQYQNFSHPRELRYGFAKVTAQFSPNVRWFGSYNYGWDDSPQDRSSGPRAAEEAMRHHNAKQHIASSQLTWTLSPSTLLDVRFGLWRFNFLGTGQDGTELLPAYFDEFSGYNWGRWARGNGATDKRNYNGSAGLTHYVDDWGGSHEFKAGLDYQDMNGDFTFWNENSVFEWRAYDQNLYYYRGLRGLDGPDPVLGDGRITFTTAASSEGGAPATPALFTRVGGFVSDIWRVNDRLTLNLGLRYDSTSSEIGDLDKGPSDPLAQAIGEAVFLPRWGINPFDTLTSAGKDDRVPWKGFSANAGFTWNLTGDGLTILKGSFARYQNRLLGWNFDGGVPTGGANFPMNWFDLNENQQLDPPGVDRYEQATNASPAGLVGTAWHENIDPNTKTPYMNEFRAGIERQLGDFNVGVAGIYRDRKNQITDLLYDLETGEYWSGVDSGYWIPFTTTVPAAGDEFPAVPVTMYFQSVDAPARFTRQTNVPDATARYTALDITVNRRWKGDFMLGGSVVFSKNYGTYETAGGTGLGQFQDPNFLINRTDARQPFDRPVVVKLWGSVRLPGAVRASFNFIQSQGAPWNRTVTVQPPAAWAAANGATTARQTIWLEPRGARREQSTTNLDLRVEKLFRIGDGHEIGLFADVFNSTGFSYLTFQSNPGGVWSPLDENTTEGTFSPASTGARSQIGVRTIRFSVRYRFN